MNKTEDILMERNSCKNEDFWREILVNSLKKKNVQGAGGIYGLDGHKYTAKDYFYISEPTAKTIADLFIEFEKIENNFKYDQPNSTLRSDKENSPLKIENEDFLIISLNSRLLYATNVKHCIFAYRCTFSFVIMLFSNYSNIEPKSPLYEKLIDHTQIMSEKTDKSENQGNVPLSQEKQINPEIYARIILEIANEIISQGG